MCRLPCGMPNGGHRNNSAALDRSALCSVRKRYDFRLSLLLLLLLLFVKSEIVGVSSICRRDLRGVVISRLQRVSPPAAQIPFSSFIVGGLAVPQRP